MQGSWPQEAGLAACAGRLLAFLSACSDWVHDMCREAAGVPGFRGATAVRTGSCQISETAPQQSVGRCPVSGRSHAGVRQLLLHSANDLSFAEGCYSVQHKNLSCRQCFLGSAGVHCTDSTSQVHNVPVSLGACTDSNLCLQSNDAIGLKVSAALELFPHQPFVPFGGCVWWYCNVPALLLGSGVLQVLAVQSQSLVRAACTLQEAEKHWRFWQEHLKVCHCAHAHPKLSHCLESLASSYFLHIF